MFEGFANVWTPVAQARRLKSHPLAIEVAGEAVVLFRTADGALGALLDRCPHRGVALSLGRLTQDGCLECPFHGWRFAPNGENRGAPLNPDAKLGLLGAIPLPVRQLGELIWLYTAPGPTAPCEPAPPQELTLPGLSRTYLERFWACHWTRAMENMLDSPHLPFVHRRTIGRAMRRHMGPDTTMQVSWEDTASGGRAKASLDGEDSGATLTFTRPNMMTLNIPVPGRRLSIHALVLPLDGDRTQLTVVGSRDFARLPLLDPVFNWLNGRIADEDQAVVESSRPRETPEPGAEPSVGTDRATLRFRKYYYETLRASAAVG